MENILRNLATYLILNLKSPIRLEQAWSLFVVASLYDRRDPPCSRIQGGITGVK